MLCCAYTFYWLSDEGITYIDLIYILINENLSFQFLANKGDKKNKILFILKNYVLLFFNSSSK